MGISAGRPTCKRHRFLLSFVGELNGGVWGSDLQKLVFLHTMSGDSDIYEFVPFRHGAYSFQLAADIDILHSRGYLKIEDVADGKESSITTATTGLEEYLPFGIAPERGNELFRRAYLEYPYYTIKSEILADLFSGRELESFIQERQSYTKTDQILFTIGYEGRSLEAFINQLIQNNVRLLCDVRKNALSRKFGYSKRKLGEITEAVRIRYVHIPGLGIESANRQSLETKKDFQDLFDRYEKDMPDRKIYLDQVESLLGKYARIALMCFERKPAMCHRHMIRDYITSKYQVKSIDL